MNLDLLTRELQLRSRKRNTARQAVSRERPPSSLASSIDVVHDHDTRSEAMSLVSASQYGVDQAQPKPSPLLSTSGLQSWVESSGTPAETAAINTSESNARLSDSIITLGTTTSATSGENASVADSVPVRDLR
jgi:peroxin-3